MSADDATRAAEALRVLTELVSLLEEQGEDNWRRGIEAAIGEIRDKDGTLSSSGFESARSIFRTMTAGGRSFAEYHVWKDDEDARIATNRRLDELRAEAWALFRP